MKSNQRPEIDKFIHNVRNSLNSIVLHAELGKMLIENNADTEQIKNAFTVILQQSKGCETILNVKSESSNDDSLS